MEKVRINNIEFFDVELTKKYQLTSIARYSEVTQYEFMKLLADDTARHLTIALKDGNYEYHMVKSEPSYKTRVYDKPTKEVQMLIASI